MFHKKTLRDVNVKGQIVLVRTDYSVPLEAVAEGVTAGEAGTGSRKASEALRISSDFRIQASLPTLQYLLAHGASKIILLSHLGRPDGRPERRLSLRLVAERLAELLEGRAVNFVDEVSGPEVEMAVESLPEGGILLLENLRFSPEEEANSEDYAREIVDSTHAELFVQDGFAVTHRAHASTSAITQLLPSVAGLLLEKEVTTLEQAMQDPAHPFVVVIGGAKVSDKMPLIEHFVPLADQIFVGGKIAADGYTSSDPKVYVAEDFDTDSTGAKLDIGPLATMRLTDMVQAASTVLWAGTLGKVEDAAYATSSTILTELLGENPTQTSIICGGDTAGFVEGIAADKPDLHFSLISTGGGAALKLLAGQDLPGIDALEDA